MLKKLSIFLELLLLMVQPSFVHPRLCVLRTSLAPTPKMRVLFRNPAQNVHVSLLCSRASQPCGTRYGLFSQIQRRMNHRTLCCSQRGNHVRGESNHVCYYGDLVPILATLVSSRLYYHYHLKSLISILPGLISCR